VSTLSNSAVLLERTGRRHHRIRQCARLLSRLARAGDVLRYFGPPDRGLLRQARAMFEKSQKGL